MAAPAIPIELQVEMDTDPGRIPYYIASSSGLLTLVILLAASIGGGRVPALRSAALCAVLISAIGVLFAKYGANFGLPWQIYYSVPMLATVLVNMFGRSCSTSAAFCPAALAASNTRLQPNA
ncbi:MAG: hypothetical protein ABL932_18825 [Terricaulis sp.]